MRTEWKEREKNINYVKISTCLVVAKYYKIRVKNDRYGICLENDV